MRPIALTPAAGFTVRTAAVDLGTKGFRFLRCLRTAMPDLPILALSNEVDGPGAVKTLMEGASGHLCRPFSPKEVLEGVMGMALAETVLCQRSQGLLVRALCGMGKWDAARPN